ncbi:unnamed protein product [Polarella glacialis]|uniref:Uncharacterized protein n=1 Tax=Polarella glacialis TaxID=89957 RepID=A0A813F8G3_POLGL|nr:unnamed protein product [Polarella glacialis]CAE8684448.1 unnamed protein product [Polarella glacialis]
MAEASSVPLPGREGMSRKHGLLLSDAGYSEIDMEDCEDRLEVPCEDRLEMPLASGLLAPPRRHWNFTLAFCACVTIVALALYGDSIPLTQWGSGSDSKTASSGSIPTVSFAPKVFKALMTDRLPAVRAQSDRAKEVGLSKTEENEVNISFWGGLRNGSSSPPNATLLPNATLPPNASVRPGTAVHSSTTVLPSATAPPNTSTPRTTRAIPAVIPGIMSPYSPAPLYEFYMYRVQSDEDYGPENQNMANVGGALWYLHHEIVFHRWIRAGTYASVEKTRIERFRVMTRATPELFKRGMNFGVVNTYDVGECTGPFPETKGATCPNLAKFGPAVGCEGFAPFHGKLGNNFPHQRWVGRNVYPGALWYSLPGPCGSSKFWQQHGECTKKEPSGACPLGSIPTGARDCTYSYEKVGDININDLENITSHKDFVELGGSEYDRDTDTGHMMTFWDLIGDPKACQVRIDAVHALFKKKYPSQPELKDPVCDFDVDKFYPHWPTGALDL